MNLNDDLLTLYSAELEKEGDRYVLEVPQRELEIGGLTDGDVHRIAILSTTSHYESTEDEPTTDTQQSSVAQRQPTPETYDEPPVEVGDQRIVVIESTGDEGDGVAKVDRGYVVIVPEASEGDRVRIELTTVRENVGFADVVDYLG